MTLALAWGTGCAAPGPDAARLGDDLSLVVAVDDNHGERAGARCADLGADWASCLKGRPILENHGATAVEGGGFRLYLHSIRRILALDHPWFFVRHVTGDLHELTPQPGFPGIPPGAQLELPFVAEYWMLQYSDVLPRPYVVADGQTPSVLARNDSDDASYMLPLAGDNWQSPSGEARAFVTAAERFRALAARGPTLGATEVAARTVPSVRRQHVSGAALMVTGLDLQLQGMTDGSVAALAERMHTLGLSASGLLVRGRLAPYALPPDLSVAGGYRLELGETGALIEGYDPAGIFHGVETLLGLIPAGGGRVPSMTIEDAPRYPHRGFMVDLARNFRQPATLARLVDQMAAYKLDELHLHLSDDEGWRVEIAGLPELTEVGARRCHDLSETRCLVPQLGSGPDNRSGGGYLTRAEYVSLLRHAASRFIEVIPEIDMPAHARAAVVSMEARYRRLRAEGRIEEAERYRLLDPADTSRTLSVQFHDRRSYLNPCAPGAKRFVEKVIDEVAAMHREAGTPLRVWHFGGDEAKNILLGSGFQARDGKDPRKGRIDLASQDKPWARSPMCEALIASGAVRSPDDLPAHFAEQVSASLARRGVRTMAVWQDGLKGTAGPTAFATPEVMVTVWDPLYWGGARSAYEWASKGYRTVLAMPDYLYFDAPYELNPKERGYYWASRATDSYKVFSFAPDNLPQNAEVMPDRTGQPFGITSEAAPAQFAGIQGHAWGELMRTDEQFEAMVYPRLLALAERAWHEAAWERPYRMGERYVLGETHLVDRAELDRDWQGFAAVVGLRELPKLERAGVRYRLPLPALSSSEGGVRAMAEWPSAHLQYSRDGAHWSPYQGVEVAAPYWRSVSGDGRRASRIESP